MSEDIATLGLGIDSTQVKEAKKSLDQLADSGVKAEQSTNRLVDSSSKLEVATRALASAYATLKITQFIQETSNLYQRYQQLGLILGVVGTNTGNLRSEIDKTVESVKNQGISMIESRQTVLKLMQSNIDLSNATKLARLAQDAATIGNVNSSQALDSLIHGVTSAQIEVLRTIGINVNFEQSYKKLADSMGVSTDSLTENQKMQARLNATLEKAPEIAGAYAASMENAGKMMKSTQRLVEDLEVQIGGLFDDSAMLAVTTYTQTLKTLTGTMEDMKARGEIKDWSQRIAIELAFVADLARTTSGIFLNLSSVVVNQLNNIKNGDFSKMSQTFADSDKELKYLLGDTTKYQDAVNNRIIQEGMLTEKITGTNNNLREHNNQTVAATTNTEKLTKAKKELTLEMLRQEESTRATIALDRDVTRVTESVMNEQEKYNKKLEELDRLKPFLGVETYSRALQKAQDELKNTGKAVQTMADDTNQYAVQAARNIQTSMANFLFNPFQDGLKGMVDGVINAVKRMVAEFVAMKIANVFGLSQIFSAGLGSTGTASASTASSGSNILSSISSGAGIANLLKGGMSGISTGISGMMSGGGIGAFALPAIGAFALNSMSNAFAGDKTLGNGFTDFMQKIPILGAGWDILAGFFGHGPMKFRQQSIQGTASADGFDGDISNVFRAKGGLLVGNKHRTQTEQFSSEQQAIFDSAIGGFYTSAKGFVDNLGLSADLVDNFTKTVQIKSEKGKTVTEEAVAEMIAGIGDSLAKNVLPNVEDFRNAGETTIQTLSRLSGEFSVLTGAAALLFDKSSGWAQDFVKQFGFADRSAFLEKAGGANAFAGNVAGFAQNFLTEDQRMKPVIESLLSERDKLGLSGINTRNQYTSAVQSGNLNPDQLIFLLQNQDTINQVFGYLEKKLAEINPVINETSMTFGDAAVKIKEANSIVMSAESARGQADELYGKSISEATQEIARLQGIAAQLRGTVSSINPMSIDQARSQIMNGGLDSSNLGDSLSALSGMGTAGFSNVLDFKRAKGANTAAINALQNVADKDIMTATRRLNELNSQKESFQQALLASVTAMTLALNKSNRRDDKWDTEGMPPVRAA